MDRRAAPVDLGGTASRPGGDEPVVSDAVAVEARTLLERARTEGTVALPYLTQIDLCALGSDDQTVIDADAWTRWSAMSDDRQRAYRDLSVEILRERGLVGSVPAATGAGGLPVSAELGVVLAARSRPVFVVTFVPADATTSEDQPRLYGLADEATASTTVLFELPGDRQLGPAGREIRYSLCSPARAADIVARWLTTTAPAGRLRHREPPTVSVVTPQDGARGGVRFRLSAVDGDRRTVTCVTTGHPDRRFTLTVSDGPDAGTGDLLGVLGEILERPGAVGG